jgi:hypothetical protein
MQSLFKQNSCPIEITSKHRFNQCDHGVETLSFQQKD